MIIWLASYPKSGNTWVRAALSSYYFSKDGEFNFSLLNNIDSFPTDPFFRNYPDPFNKPYDTAKYWLDEQVRLNSKNKYFFLKTHNALCKINNYNFTNKENSLACVYIVRDPRNIVSSLAHHYQVDIDEALSFILDEKRAIYSKDKNRYLGFQWLGSWASNLKSWVDNKNIPVLTVRYEDLQDKTYETLKKVIKFSNSFLNIKKVKDEKLKIVIQNTSFDKLKKMEFEKGFFEAITKKNTNEKLTFFRSGKNNDYKKILNKSIINKINDRFLFELKRFDYEV